MNHRVESLKKIGWGLPQFLKKTLLVIFTIVLLVTFIELWNLRSHRLDRAYKADWQSSCKVMAFFLPTYLSEPINYPKTGPDSQFDTKGTCEATKMKDGLWFLKGVYINEGMIKLGISPIRYEALMFENDDKKDLYVERFGTQYDMCSVSINGVDHTGNTRLNKCGEGAYILEYKKKHAI